MGATNAKGYPDRLIEWLFAAMMAAWGMWLLLPYPTLSNPIYASLAAVASEGTWAGLSLGVAGVRAVALWANGSYRRSPLLRIICAWVGMAWWAALFFLFLRAPIASLHAGVAWYPVFLVFEALACWRAAGDAFNFNSFRRVRAPTFIRGGT